MDILLGIVHNNERERLDYLVRELSKLQQSDFNFRIIEYGIQIEKSINSLSTLYKTFSIFYYTIRWAKYTNQRIFPKLKGELRTQVGFLLGGKERREKLQRINIICDAVSRKHLALMEIFLAGTAEYLIVLESDALLPNPNKMNDSLRVIGLPQHSDFPLWASFVQPNPKSQGKLRGLVDPASGFITQEKPWTNTACAYMVNRKLASLFIEKQSKRVYSAYPVLPIDWCLNSTFLQLSRAELGSGRYLEFETGPVVHGSIHSSGSWTQGLI
jgi:hypothetical protein